jgi:hypothetical protein
MYDLDTLRAINDEADRKAAHRAPTKITSAEQIDSYPPFPFPQIGSRCPEFDKKHERVATLFCDHSGWGSPHEPALTIAQLKTRLKELVGEHGALLVGIEQQGQFQLYLAVWKVRK